MTTTIRTPWKQVTLDGDTLSNILSVRTQHGFNLRVAEAQVTLRAMPAGIAPWQPVVIRIGASSGTAATRFTGYFVRAETQLYPNEVTLHCRGKLAHADIYEAETSVDMSSYAAYVAELDDDYGHADEIMVSTVLHLCNTYGNVSYDDSVAETGIGGTGRILGRIALGNIWDWKAGETGLSFIERLDAISLGYRTYDTFGGTVTRAQITATPAATGVATFTEAVDIFRATDTTTILDARNKIVVDGYKGQDGKATCTYTASGANSNLLHSDGVTQWYQIEKVSSAMIEKQNADFGANGISCEEVANWLLTEYNTYKERLEFTTPLYTVVNPGQTVTIDAPTRLGVSSRRFWVQEVEAGIDRRGAFAQTMTCITSVPAS
jgi:hypothetical protein